MKWGDRVMNDVELPTGKWREVVEKVHATCPICKKPKGEGRTCGALYCEH